MNTRPYTRRRKRLYNSLKDVPSINDLEILERDYSYYDQPDIFKYREVKETVVPDVPDQLVELLNNSIRIDEYLSSETSNFYKFEKGLFLN